MDKLDILKQGYTLASEHIKFRPKARILSVLGEQLISNSVIAIKELVLNAYDADAKSVHINFYRDENLKITKLEILDNGIGMTKNKIIDGWFTPATSMKTKAKKKQGSLIYKRPILGEKGVGRFACRRLGESLELRTRARELQEEFYFNLQWSQYDVEKEDIYLDEIENTIYTKKVDYNDLLESNNINDYKQGTSIIIDNLRDEWNKTKINELKSELIKLIPPFKENFDFKIFIDEEELVNDVFLEKALYYIEGIIDSNGYLYYIMNKYPRDIELKPGDFVEKIDFTNDIEPQLNKKCVFWKKENLLKSSIWNSYIDAIRKRGLNREILPQCGGFTFCAYAWNLDSINTKKVGINNKKSKDILKNLCGISIYRDGFRIWPYGSQGNDWLNLDKRAQGGQKPFHIANHQVIGYVGISEEENFNLKDTSSREGIIEEGFYFSDLKHLVLSSFSLLEHLRYGDARNKKTEREKKFWQEDNVQMEIAKFSKIINEKAPDLEADFKRLSKTYEERKKQSENKITNLLEVSSSGVVFESVTHELISFLNKMDEQSKQIEVNLTSVPSDSEEALKSNILLKEALNIVLFEVKELQPFFKAARYQLKQVDIKDVAIKSGSFFRYKFKKNKINFIVNEISPMKKKAVEGFFLQIFSNLIDNSIYWLDNLEYLNKEILITIDGENNSIYFSDNGPGIKDGYELYIFDAFYTTKKQGEGRGLGLYIIQEILSNYRGDISVSNEYRSSFCNEIQKGITFKMEF